MCHQFNPYGLAWPLDGSVSGYRAPEPKRHTNGGDATDLPRPLSPDIVCVEASRLLLQAGWGMGAQLQRPTASLRSLLCSPPMRLAPAPWT